MNGWIMLRRKYFLEKPILRLTLFEPQIKFTEKIVKLYSSVACIDITLNRGISPDVGPQSVE